MILHNRVYFKTWACNCNVKNGPPIIVAMENCFSALLGQQEYQRVKKGVLTGVDVTVELSKTIELQHRYEQACTRLDSPPIPRTTITEAMVREIESVSPAPTTGAWWKKT